MSEYDWDPKTYLALMAEEVPDYHRLQDQLVVAASVHTSAKLILDLGIGSGLSAARVLDALPQATLVGIDNSHAMLAAAASSLPLRRFTPIEQRLEDPLPSGPYDLVISMLAIHHLDGPGKADLFSRIAGALRPGGRFVLADLVIPENPADMMTPIDGVEDKPSSLSDQLTWLTAAGLQPSVSWQHRDLAVINSTRPDQSTAHVKWPAAVKSQELPHS
ncbi:class I SAM-dependent methyltransferase [Microlunatus elymi]|uniref:Class I SAM-dependent methyltransferase n=1 Tax=Microlunatus elymi TaxID=2596828 RepID=A0A516Q1I1_9ACTN|nr:class I SAM-dependent methyltransferase [Microlunatus elymi]QDP97071.1 class I SAM-dependent methyltransferase [Microlunatus elymi]